MMSNHLSRLLEQTAARHSHLCPRQVLGVRIALAGAAGLGLEIPRRDKRLLVISETDGCFVDGLEIVTGCAVGHRTLRIEDYGKIAATFVDVQTEQAFRIAPRPDVRQRAAIHAPEDPHPYLAQLRGYQVMPDDELLVIESVQILQPIRQIVGRPGVRVSCAGCGEEIINGREVLVDGQPLCQPCARGGYYVCGEPLVVVVDGAQYCAV